MKKEDKIKQKRGGTILYSKLKRLDGVMDVKLAEWIIALGGD